MQMSLVVNQPSKLEYQFQQTTTSYFRFQVRGAREAHLILTPALCEGQPMYEILIGSSFNRRSAIRRNQEQHNAVEVSTPDILDPNEFRGFWINCCRNVISVLREGENAPFMSYKAADLLPNMHVHIFTGTNGKGTWMLSSLEAKSEPKLEGIPNNSENISQNFRNVGNWVPASHGCLPPNATCGGYDECEKLYIARAFHRGKHIPGYFLPSHRVCYIASGGHEFAHCKYEILCDATGHWIQHDSECDSIPENAFPAGQTECGETLFIGRVEYQNTLTIGKVLPSHGCCYIPYHGQEYTFTKFEIYVSY